MDSPPQWNKPGSQSLLEDVEDLTTTFLQTQGARKNKRAAFGSKGRSARALKPFNAPQSAANAPSEAPPPRKDRCRVAEPELPLPEPLVRSQSSFTTNSSLSSSSSGIQAPHLPPMRMQRTMSLNLAPRSRTEEWSTPFMADDLFPSPEFLSRNNDELLEETERNMAIQSRKKRRERRVSITGTMSVGSNYSRDAVEADKSAWRKSTQDSTSPEKIPDVSQHTSSCNSNNNILGEFAFSPAMSTASSRKRGVCGSPISDVDDWSCSGYMSQSSSRHARSRVFSAELLREIASVPSLAPSFSQERIPEKDPNRRAMDPEDSDDSETDDESERDMSMTSHTDLFHVTSLPATPYEPSDKDIQFLYRALKKERGRSKVYFGAGVSWDVVPPNQWEASRRSGFIVWAKTLGFSHRCSGKSTVFLQISEARGAELVERLRRMILNRRDAKECQQQEPEQDFVKERPHLTRTAVSSMLLDSAVKRPLFDDASEMEANDLALQLGDLTMNNMVRTVTIDPVRDPTGQSRLSFDHHYASNDLHMHLRGETPQKSAIKPMRMSIASTGPFQRYGRGSSGAYSADLPPILSQDVMETPCMEQPRGWGSQPIPGRDWGVSERCSGETMQALSEAFEDAIKEAPNRDSCGDYACSTLPVMPFEPDVTLVEEVINLQVELPIDSPDNAKQRKRREKSVAKHKRMSLFILAHHNDGILVDDKTLFRSRESVQIPAILPSLSPLDEFPSAFRESLEEAYSESEAPCDIAELDTGTLATIFAFLNEQDLLCKVSLVSTRWADVATRARATLMLASVVGDSQEEMADEDLDIAEEESVFEVKPNPILQSMERSWEEMADCYPWGRFLSEGTFKQVFKVHNARVGAEEAIAVMDSDYIVDKHTIGVELAVSALLSSLARRAICPNFVLTRAVFTSPFPPPASTWGDSQNKCPLGDRYDPCCPHHRPHKPEVSHPGRYQYIQMELCNKGDAEEYIKTLPDERLEPSVARNILFQIAFALHAAAEQFSVKHYDIKLLNIFMQSFDGIDSENVVLRYGLGSHVFALRMRAKEAIMAKLADYGTANIKAESNGQPVTIAQFTTIENTPPDFMILGDEARQGHGHDNFGLGLSMLHLFTGCAPYEEIMEEVVCPPNFKRRLRNIWENEREENYEVIRSVILTDVYKDEAGNIVEGEPDETMYDTFYRFLVLFGAPDRFQQKVASKLWNAIDDCLFQQNRLGRGARKRQALSDVEQYQNDRRKYSIDSGNNVYISRARNALHEMQGGMELLNSLCAFDPSKRAKAIDVLNSQFMEPLREGRAVQYSSDDKVYSYTAFSTYR